MAIATRSSATMRARCRRDVCSYVERKSLWPPHAHQRYRLLESAALAHWRDELLAELAHHRPLQGVLAGLGSFFCIDSLPVFVDALQEDHLRLTAEAILRGFGSKARPALVAVALGSGQDGECESGSHLRKRRSALGVLSEIGVPARELARLRTLIDSSDDQVTLLACEIGIKLGGAADRVRIAARLRDLRPTADWIHREQIDELAKSLSSSG